MPEKTLKNLYSKIPSQLKACFFASLIVGLLAHFYKITNWLPNWDSLVFRYDPQNMLPLGRWFLAVVCSFSSFFDLPFLNGLIAIIFHGLGAVFICKILGVKKGITAFLIGGVVSVFPTVTSVMMYNYVADGYAISFFFSVLAAYLMTKEKPQIIIPAILIALAVGIYQAYITVTIMLVLLKLLDFIVFDKKDFVPTFKKALCNLVSGALGMALYGIVLKVLLAATSSELLDYQGINSTASMEGLNISASLYVIKETFVSCFFDFSNGLSVFVALNILVFAFSFFYYIKAIIKNKVYKNSLNILLVLVIGVMLLLGSSALAFVNADVDYHNLMLMGYVVFYMFFIILYERKTCKKEEFKCWLVLILSVCLILNLVVISNVSYHKAQMAYERSFGTLIRIADRIEQTENSEKCEKIVVIGALENSRDYSVNLSPDITGITKGYILRADDESVNQSVLTSALSDYCEKDYEFVSGEEKQEFLKKDAVKSMGIWPSEDSVSVVDNTLIIKLSTEGDAK